MHSGTSMVKEHRQKFFSPRTSKDLILHQESILNLTYGPELIKHLTPLSNQLRDQIQF